MGLIDVIEQLNTFGFFTVLLIFCLVVLGIIFAVKTFKEAGGLFGKSHRQLMDEEFMERINSLEKRADTLEESAKKFKDDRVNDRAQSHEIQGKWMDIVNDINDKQDKIIKRVDDLAEQNRKYQLADIRETLLQAYRYYTSDSTNPLKMWSELEFHAWSEQYDVYVANKGNGYIQGTVKKEMDKLRVVPLDDYELMAELMSSRTRNKG